MEKNNEVIQTHPLVGWDISTVDSYDALMLRLHYQNPTQESDKRSRNWPDAMANDGRRTSVYFYSGSRNSEDRIWRLPGK